MADPSDQQSTRKYLSYAIPSLVFIALSLNWTCDLLWESPGSPHHVDEIFLPYESIALWEGIKPRELGWPAATARPVYSVIYGLMSLTRATPEITAQISSGNVTELFSTASTLPTHILHDPATFFIVGRIISATFGLLTILSIVWAGTRWGGALTGLWAGIIAALSPDLIFHSQVLLADVIGILAVSVALGLMETRSELTLRKVLLVALACGCATATKHHFGIWIVPLFAYCISSCKTFQTSELTRFLSYVTAAVITLACSYLLFVPEWWQNPILMMKEFLAVVASKMISAESLGPWEQSQDSFQQLTTLLFIITNKWGILLIFCACLNIKNIRRPHLIECGLFSMLMLIALALWQATSITSRYMQPAFPVAVLFAAHGISKVSLKPSTTWYAVRVAIPVVMLFSSWQLLESQRRAGSRTRDTRAAAWINENIPAGKIIAIPELFTERLPRSLKNLAELEDQYTAAELYKNKLSSNGIEWDESSRPFKSAILNDEAFYLYWARKEKLIRKENEGYDLLIHSRGKRVTGVQQDALIQQIIGASKSDRSVDFALLEKSIDPASERTILRASFSDQSSLTLYLYEIVDGVKTRPEHGGKSSGKPSN